jgi:circadian clock protein KaiC
MKAKASDRLLTGVAGLDEILDGGFIPGRAYMVRGGPGAGKTTLGLHFLTAGVAHGEKGLFITLAEPEAKIRQNAASIGLQLDGIDFLDLSPTEEFFAKEEAYDIFSPAEVERQPMTQKIIAQIEAIQPQRVFLDALTHFRYLATDAFQFRKLALSFLHFLIEQQTTVLFTSEGSASAPDDDLQFISDGIIELFFSTEERMLEVTKMRASSFQSGQHSMQLSATGMAVFPRLLPKSVVWKPGVEMISSGVPELDQLLNGGLEQGTVTVISGPSGVGKTTLGMQIMNTAAARGDYPLVYTFDEEVEIILRRCDATSIPARAMIKRDAMRLEKVEPLQFTPDQFAHLIRRDVKKHKSRLVMIDSISAYQLALRGRDLITQLHSLCKYLQGMDLTVFLIAEFESITGQFQATDFNISYLADNIIFMRYLELKGEMRKAIGVLKKRLSDFEKTLRWFEITSAGIKIGKPLLELRGILSGIPEWVESSSKSEELNHAGTDLDSHGK